MKNQLPFSCDKNRVELLLDALKKSTEEEKEEEVTKTSMGTAAVAVLSDLNNIFRSKDKERRPLWLEKMFLLYSQHADTAPVEDTSCF